MIPLAQLETCFRESLGLASDAAVETISYQGDPAWDSLGHMRLIAAIETKFGVAFTTDEILALSNFQEACSLLEKRGINVGAP